MNKDIPEKHVVWAEKPGGSPIAAVYLSLKEANMAAASLERSGYRILEIVPKTLAQGSQ